MTATSGARVAALAAMSALLLGGCAADGGVDDPAPPLPTYEPDPDEIATLRATADLAPCPETSAGLAARPSAGESAVEQRRLPVITLSCLGDGPAVDLGALGGIPYVVNVWASWCVPCAEEMPYLQEVYEQAAGRVGVLGVDFEDSPERALLASADFGISFPSVMDPDGVTQVPLQFQGPPATFFVSAEGEIVATETGQLTSAQQVRDLVAEHLGVVL